MRGNASLTSSIGEGGCVVPGGVSYDASCCVLLAEAPHGITRASRLERARLLKEFALEKGFDGEASSGRRETIN